jgi:hypothetical protein
MSRRRIFILVLALLVVGAGIAVAVLATRDNDHGSKNPRVALPAVTVDEARATLSYLDGKGAALMRMHLAATEEPLKGGRQRCEQVVRRLDAAASSMRVATLVSGIQDEPMRAAFGEERLALGVALTRCVRDGQATPGDSGRLTRATDLSKQRLDELREAVR